MVINAPPRTLNTRGHLCGFNTLEGVKAQSYLEADGRRRKKKQKTEKTLFLEKREERREKREDRREKREERREKREDRREKEQREARTQRRGKREESRDKREVIESSK